MQSIFGTYESDGNGNPEVSIKYRFNNLDAASSEKGEIFLGIADRYIYQRSLWQLNNATSRSDAYLTIHISLQDDLRVLFLYQDGTMLYNRTRYDIGLFNRDGQQLFKELSQFIIENQDTS